MKKTLYMFANIFFLTFNADQELFRDILTRADVTYLSRAVKEINKFEDCCYHSEGTSCDIFTRPLHHEQDVTQDPILRESTVGLTSDIFFS